MEKVLHDAIKQRIRSLTELSFHYFIDELYLKCYGNEFVPIKQKRDKGCDGILHGDTSLAIYSPEEYKLKAFKKKVEEDFNNYEKNLSDKYPKWQVVFNGQWTTEMVNFVRALKSDSQIVGSKHILEMIKDLKWSRLKEIADYLNIDKEFFIYDILAKVIEDLLEDQNTGEDISIAVKKATYIEKKIKLNYSKKDIEAALEEYEDCVVIFPRIQGIIKGYNEPDKGALKRKIKDEYDRQYPVYKDFKKTLNYLTDHYSARNAKDDIYKFYVRVVLIYFFEQCLIGKKTKEEKSGVASS